MPHCPEQIGAQSLPLRLDLGLLLLFDMGSKRAGHDRDTKQCDKCEWVTSPPQLKPVIGFHKGIIHDHCGDQARRHPIKISIGRTGHHQDTCHKKQGCMAVIRPYGLEQQTQVQYHRHGHH